MQFKKQLWLIIAAGWGVVAHAETNWVTTATHAMKLTSAPQNRMLLAVGAAATNTLSTLDASQKLHVVVSLKLQNTNDLDQRLEQIRAGQLPPMTPDQFTARYAPSNSQVQSVIDYLTNNGFSHIQVAVNRQLISADGDSGAVKNAFNTPIQRNTAGQYANISDVQVPAVLGGIVLAVQGLQNIATMHTMSQKPMASTASSGVIGHSPTDFEQIYGAAELANAQNTTIGIITQGYMNQTLTDLKTFTNTAGFPPVATHLSYVDNQIITQRDPDPKKDGTGEWNLDSQTALSTAGGAVKEMRFYVAPTMQNNDIVGAFNLAVTENVAQVVNISLGECETADPGFVATADQIFKQGVLQGQTFSVSTGDNGAYTCGGNTPKTSYPAVSPYVVAVGGTTLVTKGNTIRTSESAWTNGGGGQSTLEVAPNWQLNAKVLGTSNKRGIPDIAFDGDPDSGALIYVDGEQQQIGGTSLSAPIFTGFWARILSANANRLSNPVPSIYQYAAANPTLFNPITKGSNGAYSAHAGWNYTTGWGSLKVDQFAQFIATH